MSGVDWNDVKEPEPNCPDCHGSGERDSGGVQPWGEGIFIRCQCTFKSYCEQEDEAYRKQQFGGQP